MATNLPKKERFFLVLSAFIIALGWFLPILIKNVVSKYEANTTINKNSVKTTNPVNKEKGAIQIAKDYLSNLEQLPYEKAGEILGMNGPIISKTQILSAEGNNEKTTVSFRVFVLNSYLDGKIFLVSTSPRINDLWKIEKVEIGDRLFYENNGFKIWHPKTWEIYKTGNNPDALEEWSLEDQNGEVLAIFMIEEKGGNYSLAIEQCKLEESKGMSNCQEEKFGDKTYHTAIFQDLVKMYSWAGDENNLVIIGTNEKNREVLEKIIRDMILP